MTRTATIDPPPNPTPAYWRRFVGANGQEPRAGEGIYRYDSHRQEIVIRWFYWNPCGEPDGPPEQVWFEKRLDRREYLTRREVEQEYRLTREQWNRLAYSEMFSWLNDHNCSEHRYFYARARVREVIDATAGHQPTLF